MQTVPRPLQASTAPAGPPSDAARQGGVLDMPALHFMALLIALLVLAIAGVMLAAQRRRAREHRLHLSALREREEKLRLALWASDELYWQ